MSLRALALVAFACAVLSRNRAQAQQADLILHGGKIVTVDAQFRLAEALAVAGDRLLAVGTNAEVLALAGPKTQRLDLQGKTVLPGLIDSHSHPTSAAVFEFDHEVPAMESIADVLAYVKARAAVVPRGEWIGISQVFVTRLRERRFPTRAELDAAAPDHPVAFRTGPDASLNSLALQLCGIDRAFQITDGKPGQVERDPATGEPTGILRNCGRFIKARSTAKSPTAQDRAERLKALFAAYNQVGITGVTDRGVGDESLRLYEQLLKDGALTCRVFLTYYVDAQGPLEKIEAGIQRAASHPLHAYNNLLWLRGLKIYLDGGMLTGSAYLLKPWGPSAIYSITDPEYRGILFVEPDKLARIAAAALRADLQLTAHCVGDGAVETLVGAYERVNAELPVRERRPCLSHANFMTPAAIEKMARLGIVADLQPAWLYLDGATLRAHFGDERLAFFQPYKTLAERGVTVGGGSDHMQKIGRRRSINTYDPFLGMWTALTRQPRWTEQPLRPEQAITREQAIRLYTINNAFLTFEEKEKGSLEKGKLADFIVLDRDILTCPLDAVKDIEVEQTWLGGRRVHPAN
ncbi:MAG TPA: amidohydrolase [Planctomycetota bacterium]|nr:amidohydrolase [Planctomycetota bacterium]HRR82213.1 amidohydrolase [Planctomycetota bacterium]HRT96262.1 amidohydrolase [Planctomycetota bacterium]